MNVTKINIKLNAIRAKDAKAIFEDHIYLPKIGYPKSEQQVKDWLAVRENALVSALNTKNDEELTGLIQTSITVLNKDVETLKVGSEAVKQLTASEFDELCKIRLYQFALGE